MANFTTHIAVGTIVSGGLATLTLAADVVAPENLIAVTMAGVLGSVLPDIDLKDSRPSQAMFSGLAVFFSFAVLFSAAEHLSIVEMLIAWLGTLIFVRYGAKAAFHGLSYHRGIWHSVLAAVFCACVTAVVYYYLLGRPDGVAWLAGGFMFLGFMTHLILDEIYSVDVMDIRVKASFGTAVKLIDTNRWGHTAAMAVATALVIMITPPTKTFASGISSEAMWSGLQKKMLPVDRDKWFGIDWKTVVARASQLRPQSFGAPQALPTTSPITTGTLPEPVKSADPAKPADVKPSDVKPSDKP
jgi:LexA-binding, inner membrane-associated putative hydrolase